MSAVPHNMVGLIELTDAEELLDRHGKLGFGDLQRVFQQRLQSWIRTRDQWEQIEDNRFCVVLRGITTRGELELAAAKLERLFREPHYQFGKAVELNIRAGFTRATDPENEMELALRQAKKALREARRSKSVYGVYTPEEVIRADAERELLKQLENAVGAGELQLYYQPKINTTYQTLAGAEALMRWHTRDNRVIPPGEFIEVAESNEVIRPMTFWAIKSAVARLARWPEELTIAVNVAPQLLLDDQILAVVSDSLEIHEVTPGRLVLEVTERVMVDNQEVMLQQLARLRNNGVKISLDDFGTGFSSFAYFRDLPVDEIKIDRCFVQNMLECGKDHAIVKALIDLAHNFSMKVVAEGVETGEIAERLKELGCDILQGFFFDRPLEVDTFEASYGIQRPIHGAKKPMPSHPIN